MLSLFVDLRPQLLSLMALHYATVMRGRAVARPSCVYTPLSFVDVINHDVALQSSLEIRIWNVDFGIEFRFRTPHRVESIGKTSIFGRDSAINR